MTKKKSERGQSLVEMAISITVLVFLLSGAVEFGMMFFQYIQLRDAAQEGALYGSLNPADASGIEARTRGASSSPIKLTDPVVLVDIITNDENGDGLICPGDSIEVRASYPHEFFMPFITLITGPGGRTLTGSVTDTILNSTTSGCP